VSALLLAALLVTSLIPAFAASSAMVSPAAPDGVGQGKSDDLDHPLGAKQQALRQEALQAKLNGKAYGRSHEVARGQFVELERMGEDSIFTVSQARPPRIRSARRRPIPSRPRDCSLFYRKKK
jgi:immune inhibitor A